MKISYKKIITAILAIIICFNFIFPKLVLATEDESESASETSSDYDEENGIKLPGILDTVFGVLTYIPKLTLLAPGLVANSVLSLIANVDSSKEWEFVTLEDILFNNVELTDVNIFLNEGDSDGVLSKIGDSVAGWYMAFRNLALVVSLLMLLYVGIKMALDNFAPSRAKYKHMLIDWVKCLALIMVLDLIIVMVLNINTATVNMLKPEDIGNGEEYTQAIFTWAFDISLVKSWGSAIMYSILGIISFSFLVIYIKRMLMTCFLVMIAPIVGIFYSLDKVGDGKSKILSTWLKEFCYNVLIQPFHCIVYIVFVGTAMRELYSSTENPLNFKYMVIAITCTICIFMGEKIIRTIFGFTKSQSVAKKLFNATMISSVINNVKQVYTTRAGSISEEGEDQTPAIAPSGRKTEDVINNMPNKTHLKEVHTGETEQDSAKPIFKSRKSYTTSSESTSDTTVVENSNSSVIQPVIVGSTLPQGSNTNDKGDSTQTKTQNQKPEQTSQNKNDRTSKKDRKKDNVTLFIEMADDYRNEVNPDMTDEQLALKTEIIRKTSLSELQKSKNITDIRYKIWITDMENVLKNRGIEEPGDYIYKVIKDRKQI